MSELKDSEKKNSDDLKSCFNQIKNLISEREKELENTIKKSFDIEYKIIVNFLQRISNQQDMINEYKNHIQNFTQISKIDILKSSIFRDELIKECLKPIKNFTKNDPIIEIGIFKELSNLIKKFRENKESTEKNAVKLKEICQSKKSKQQIDTLKTPNINFYKTSETCLVDEILANHSNFNHFHLNDKFNIQPISTKSVSLVDKTFQRITKEDVLNQNDVVKKNKQRLENLSKSYGKKLFDSSNQTVSEKFRKWISVKKDYSMSSRKNSKVNQSYNADILVHNTHKHSFQLIESRNLKKIAKSKVARNKKGSSSIMDLSHVSE